MTPSPTQATSMPTMGSQWDWRAQKVQPWHTDRLAVVYVRQSSPQQVLHHQESTRLQYGLSSRAQDLGWATERILVLDDDQATSGQNLLKNPIYAGAYAYGRRQVDPHRVVRGQCRPGPLITEPEHWLAFLPDRVPAYISREQYERNLAQLEANRARGDTRGAARQGSALARIIH